MKLKLILVLSAILISMLNFSNSKINNKKNYTVIKSYSFCTGLKELGSDGGTGAETLSRFYNKCVVNGETYSGTIEVTYSYKFKDIFNGKVKTIKNKFENGKKFLNDNLSETNTMIFKEKTKIYIKKEENGYETSTRIKSNDWKYEKVTVNYTIELDGNRKKIPIEDTVLKK